MTPLDIVLFILSVTFHELGHALAMRRHGIQMEEICLFGIGGSRLFSFRIKRLFGGTPVVARTVILGGKVTPTYYGHLRTERLPLSKYGQIAGGGIAANFIYGAVLIAIACIIDGRISISLITVIGILLLFGLLIRYTFYAFPLIGLLVLYLLVQSIVSSPSEFVQNYEMIVKIWAELYDYNRTSVDSIRFAGMLSVALGLMNCLPFLPLDGGKITLRIIEKMSWHNRKIIRWAYSWVTGVPMLILILLAIGDNILKLISVLF